MSLEQVFRFLNSYLERMRPDDALAAPIAIGIGVHAGHLMPGTIGDNERMDGTVISDSVNLSSRLEGLTRRYGAGILTSGETVKAIAEPGRFRFVDRVKVHGRADATLVFECLDGDPDEVRERKLSYREDLARAIRLY